MVLPRRGFSIRKSNATIVTGPPRNSGEFKKKKILGQSSEGKLPPTSEVSLNGNDNPGASHKISRKNEAPPEPLRCQWRFTFCSRHKVLIAFTSPLPSWSQVVCLPRLRHNSGLANFHTGTKETISSTLTLNSETESCSFPYD